MTIARKSRMYFWLARELSRKYTKFLIGGIFIGMLCIALFSQLWPFIKSRYFLPTERIGIVGEYSPSNLPDSILSKISLGLTKASISGEAEPGLATSWEATDSGKRWVFQLGESRTWHDGEPLLPSDITYNIKDVTFSSDKNTVIATLPSSFSPFPLIVSKPLFKAGLTGLGSYKVDRLVLKGDKVSMIRLVPVDPETKTATEYHIYRTENLATMAYKLGEIDKVEDLTTVEQSIVHFVNSKVSAQTMYNRIISLYFNLSDPLLKEKNVRQALAYAVPDMEMERALSPISKTSWAYTETIKHYPYDMKMAGKLLAPVSSGSLSGELTIVTFSQYLDIAQQIASSWNLLGIKTNVRVENKLPNEFQVLVSAHDLPNDPDQYALWHSRQTTTNITKYNNPKIDKLLEDGRQELSIELRKKLYSDFARRFMEEIPAYPLFYPKTYSIIRK